MLHSWESQPKRDEKCALIKPKVTSFLGGPLEQKTHLFGRGLKISNFFTYIGFGCLNKNSQKPSLVTSFGCLTFSASQLLWKFYLFWFLKSDIILHIQSIIRHRHQLFVTDTTSKQPCL